MKSVWFTRVGLPMMQFNVTWIRRLLPSRRHGRFCTNALLEKERLGKLLARNGLASRRICESWIRAGHITVNAEKITNINAKANALLDDIRLDDISVSSKLKPSNSIAKEHPKIWIVNKLQGELLKDSPDFHKNRPWLFDRIHKSVPLPPHYLRENVYNYLKPINRLDFNSEGLLLLTNNGSFAKSMLSDKDMTKVYRIRIFGKLTPSKLAGLRRGMYLSNAKYPPLDVTIDNTKSTGATSWIIVTVPISGYGDKAQLKDSASKQNSAEKILIQALSQIHIKVARIICVAVGPYNLKELDLGSGEVREARVAPKLAARWLNST